MTSYAKLRELAEKATDGPWHAYDRGVGHYVCTSIGPGEYDYTPLPEGLRTDIGRPEDAEYIAAVDPQTVVGLLDEIELLRSGRGGAPETGGQS